MGTAGSVAVSDQRVSEMSHLKDVGFEVVAAYCRGIGFVSFAFMSSWYFSNVRSSEITSYGTCVQVLIGRDLAASVDLLPMSACDAYRYL